MYPTWFGQLLRSTLILYDRKEDEIRGTVWEQERRPNGKGNLIDYVLIRLRNPTDVEPGSESGIYSELVSLLPRAIEFAKDGDLSVFLGDTSSGGFGSPADTAREM